MNGLLDTLLLGDHNTRVVATGSALLGLACGVLGTFMLLRRRALVADALGHATLPGIGVAFLLGTGAGRSLPALLAGGLASALLGMGCLVALRRWSRLKDDAALGIVLSVFFGAGIVLLSIIQQMPGGAVAGLQTFILGQPAAMLGRDAGIIAGTAVVVLLGCGAFRKELTLLCFDQQYAAAHGLPTLRLDLALMAGTGLLTVVGLKAVGAILIVALLVIPPATARLWTHRLGTTILLAGLFGCITGWAGTCISALVPAFPAGPVIVLCGSSLFVVSLLFGRARGLVAASIRRAALRRELAARALLEALYEREQAAGTPGGAQRDPLLTPEAPPGPSRTALRRAMRAGLVSVGTGGARALTPAGRQAARDLVRERCLVRALLQANPASVGVVLDRAGRGLEEVADSALLRRLERELEERCPWLFAPLET